MVYPCSYFITTDSMQFPSVREKRYFTVPSSLDTSFLLTLGKAQSTGSCSFSLVTFPTFVISSSSMPLWSCVNICLALYAGSPNDTKSSFSSSGVYDNMFFIILFLLYQFCRQLQEHITVRCIFTPNLLYYKKMMKGGSS